MIACSHALGKRGRGQSNSDFIIFRSGITVENALSLVLSLPGMGAREFLYSV